MRIDRLDLQNFKKFAQLGVDLHPHFTLLIGENGSGKTSILDAMAVAMAVWLVRPPDSEVKNSRRNILPTEVRLEASQEGDRIQFRERTPTVITAIGEIAGKETEWTRKTQNWAGSATINSGSKGALRIVQELYTKDRQGEKVVCPVLAYYGAGRAWISSNERTRKRKRENGIARRWGAFYDCFNERIRFAELKNWFRNEALAAVNRGGRMRPGFEVVRRAVLACVPESDALWFDGDRQEIVLSIRKTPQPFDNLSAGQRMMLALVADIAIKAITQNAFLLPEDELGPTDSPVPRVLSETPGVVLIDELDVHLHPKWQRRVATDLKKNFPLIQFVCTSHSPQVIGELSRDEIRVLEDDRVTIPPVALGADANWILEHVMGAEDRNEAASQAIRRVEDALEDGDLSAAREELNNLRGRVDGDEGEVARLDATIRNIEALAHADD